MKKTIGDFVPVNPYFLAPMAGFSDSAYRTLCQNLGAGLTYTEMVSAKGLYYGDRKSPELLYIGEEETAVGYQIFGSDPDIMAWAAEKLNNEKNVLLDINMGCPVPKVVKNGEGSALLRDPELIYRIVNKVSCATDKPVTVKMRIGIDGMPDGGYIECAQAAESGGVSAIAVHGRTREQYYSGRADREAIRRIKASVRVPVIGNGDIESIEDGDRMMEETGCDFVMIGRAAVGNPWIFSPGRDPSVEDIKNMIVSHYRSLEKNKGEYVAVREMRKFVGRYLRGIPGSLRVRRAVNSIESGDELCKLIEREV